MATDSQSLYIGFVEDFKNEPTLLILGESEGFWSFAELIESKSAGRLSLLRPRIKQRNIDLQIAYEDESGELTREGTEFLWTLSNHNVRFFSDQLRELAASRGACHAYLDIEPPGDSNIQIIASKGEYDPVMMFGS